MEWQIDNDRPIYAQLIQQIERAVVSGVWAPGQKLPGVRELALQAGVNPNTMQRALAQLEETGLLYTQRTSGRFVTEDAALIARLQSDEAMALTRQWVQDMAELGCGEDEMEACFRRVRGC